MRSSSSSPIQLLPQHLSCSFPPFPPTAPAFPGNRRRRAAWEAGKSSSSSNSLWESVRRVGAKTPYRQKTTTPRTLCYTVPLPGWTLSPPAAQAQGDTPFEDSIAQSALPSGALLFSASVAEFSSWGLMGP